MSLYLRFAPFRPILGNSSVEILRGRIPPLKKFLLYGVLAIVVIGAIGACGEASQQQAKTASTNAPEVGKSGRARPPLGGKARPVKEQHSSSEAGAEVETYGGFSGASC
jgi:hypothetical protein